jgi:rhomboid-like protein
MFSGLVSHIISAKFKYPRLVAQLAAASTAPTALAKTVSPTAAAVTPKVTADILPSLGASGAVYAAVVMTALGFPDTEIALIIPPSAPIPIQWGVGGLVAMDILGVIRGWRYLLIPFLLVSVIDRYFVLSGSWIIGLISVVLRLGPCTTLMGRNSGLI